MYYEVVTYLLDSSTMRVRKALFVLEKFHGQTHPSSILCITFK